MVTPDDLTITYSTYYNENITLDTTFHHTLLTTDTYWLKIFKDYEHVIHRCSITITSKYQLEQDQIPRFEKSTEYLFMEKSNKFKTLISSLL